MNRYGFLPPVAERYASSIEMCETVFGAEDCLKIVPAVLDVCEAARTYPDPTSEAGVRRHFADAKKQRPKAAKAAKVLAQYLRSFPEVVVQALVPNQSGMIFKSARPEETELTGHLADFLEEFAGALDRVEALPGV